MAIPRIRSAHYESVESAYIWKKIVSLEVRKAGLLFYQNWNKFLMYKTSRKLNQQKIKMKNLQGLKISANSVDSICATNQRNWRKVEKTSYY